MRVYLCRQDFSRYKSSSYSSIMDWQNMKWQGWKTLKILMDESLKSGS